MSGFAYFNQGAKDRAATRRHIEKLNESARMADLTVKPVREVYEGSNGEDTKALYAKLESLGPEGVIALNLFRACKCSERAKGYRRGHKSEAYDRKNWSMGLLCEELVKFNAYPPHYHLPFVWGWKEDPAQEFHKWVLYVELVISSREIGCSKPGCGYGDGKPCIGCGRIVLPSQVSFHALARGKGPDYPGEWDGKHESANRIIAFCEDLLGQPRSTPHPCPLPIPQKAAGRGEGVGVERQLSFE